MQNELKDFLISISTFQKNYCIADENGKYKCKKCTFHSHGGVCLLKRFARNNMQYCENEDEFKKIIYPIMSF